MVDIYDIFDEIEDEKNNFMNSTFVSPIMHHNYVLVRISGLVYKFKVLNPEMGWYTLSPVKKNVAKIVRPLDHIEREEYLNIFDDVYFIALYAKNDILYCYPKGDADKRFGANDITPVLLADLDLVDIFDVIQVKFDGRNYWFKDIDFNSNPLKSQNLRDNLDSFNSVGDVRIKGMTPFERNSYMIMLEIKKANEVNCDEIMLRRMVENSDAEFIDYVEKSKNFEVQYSIDGVQQPKAIISKDGFNIVSSGICLTNEGVFDLKSLVSVMRERQNLGGDPNRHAWHREDGYNERNHW